MTINTPLAKVTAAGNGVATVFSFAPLTLFSHTDLEVRFVSTTGIETVLTEGVGTSNYSLTLDSPSSLPSVGSITYPATLGTKLQTGESLIMKRIVSVVQNTDLGNQGGYFPEVQEATFDYETMIDIQQQDLIDRSIKLNTHTTGFSVELPNPVVGYGLVWGSSALTSAPLTMTVDTSSTLINVSAIQPALVDGRIWIDTSVAGQRVVRICDGADYNEIVRFATAGGAITYVIPSTFTAALGISLAAAGTPLALTVLDPGATGVIETTDHNSVSPAISDVIWKKTFQGRDSGAAVQTYAEDQVVITDPTAASEDANRTFRTVVAGTVADRLKVGAGIFTPSVTDKGVDTINAVSLYANGTLMAASDVSIQAGPTHAPSLSDHGKTFIYTGVCTITMPAASGLFPGWQIFIQNAASANLTFNRSSTDLIVTKGNARTTINVPSNGDNGRLILDSTGGTAKFYWQGRRSFEGAEFATTITTATTQAHGLGIVPDNIWAVLRNKVAELNYNIGDESKLGGHASDAAGTGAGFGMVADTTNVTGITTTVQLKVQNKTTAGAAVVITAADWKLVMRAEVWN